MDAEGQQCSCQQISSPRAGGPCSSPQVLTITPRWTSGVVPPLVCSPGFVSFDADDRLAGDVYDANGNTVNSGGIGNVYDFENHLIQQGGATMVYDGNGNRVSKTVAGLTTNFLISEINPTGYAQVVSESFSGGTGNREESHAYVYGLDRISQNRLAFINSQNINQVSYYIYDGHGSVRALTDPSGNVTDTYDYDAFGNEIHTTTTLASPTVNEFLFAGEQFDSDLRLYYNRARYLNVTTGRFWSMDTFDGDISSPLSLHKYLYASADPVNALDPSGNQDSAQEAEAEAIGETLDTQTSPQQVLEGEKEAKVAQIYFAFGLGNFGGGGKLFGIIPIPHAYIFADVTGGQSARYDVALDEEEGATISSAMVGTVPGYIQVTPANLAEVRADSLLLTQTASLSILEYGTWRAGLPAVALATTSITSALNGAIDGLPIEYQAFALGGTNCIAFSLAASALAKTLQSAPF